MTKVSLNKLVKKLTRKAELSISDFESLTLSQLETLCLSLGPDERHRVYHILDGSGILVLNLDFLFPERSNSLLGRMIQSFEAGRSRKRGPCDACHYLRVNYTEVADDQEVESPSGSLFG